MLIRLFLLLCFSLLLGSAAAASPGSAARTTGETTTFSEKHSCGDQIFGSGLDVPSCLKVLRTTSRTRIQEARTTRCAPPFFGTLNATPLTLPLRDGASDSFTSSFFLSSLRTTVLLL